MRPNGWRGARTSRCSARRQKRKLLPPLRLPKPCSTPKRQRHTVAKEIGKGARQQKNRGRKKGEKPPPDLRKAKKRNPKRLERGSVASLIFRTLLCRQALPRRPLLGSIISTSFREPECR